jgi:hypothetical protein
VNRRILVFGEGTTELRGPGERWTGCGRTLLTRLFGSPPPDLLTLEERMLSRFRRDLDLAGEPLVRGEDAQAALALRIASTTAQGLVLMRDSDRSVRRPHGERRLAVERGSGLRPRWRSAVPRGARAFSLHRDSLHARRRRAPRRGHHVP